MRRVIPIQASSVHVRPRKTPRFGEQPKLPSPDLTSWKDAKTRTALAINLASVIEKADEQVLPAMYTYVGLSFGARAEDLGRLTFARAVSQAMFSPVGGVLGHCVDRSHVIAAGCILWGLMTFFFGFVDSVPQGLPLWALNGVGLSMVIPNAQSLTADYHGTSSRGRAFGLLYLTSAVGGMLGQLYATNVGGHSVEAWRFVMFSVGVFSVLVGIANLFMSREPRRRDSAVLESENCRGRERESSVEIGRLMSTTWESVKMVLSVPTFVMIVAQGIVGTFPWNAIVFMTHYLQLIGMSGLSASFLMATFLGATAIGGLLGGIIGDFIGSRYPLHGRILTAQFSVAIKLPFVVLLLRGLPLNSAPSTVAIYGLVMCVMGILASWAAPACNNPIFAEIVPSSHRNLVYAFDRSFEGAIAACGAPIVGWLAQEFGYMGSVHVTGNPILDLPNAHALGNALLVCLLVPWAICFLVYTGLHWTYKRDRENARMLEKRAMKLEQF